MGDEPATAIDRLYDLPEAARLTGLTVDALRKRASRGRLQQIKGNDGVVRVRLTTADLTAIRHELSGHGRSEPDLSGQIVQTVQPGVVELHERAARAEGEASELRQALARVQAQADVQIAEARVEVGQVRGERDQARQEREDARVRAAAAEGEAKALREALTEARRPAWRRWIGLP